MTKTFRTLDDVDVKSKRVLLRVDLNVPMENGKVSDATRIERVAPTITELADKGGKVILLAHFGRPKGPDPKESLKPVADAVARTIGRPVAFAAATTTPTVRASCAAGTMSRASPSVSGATAAPRPCTPRPAIAKAAEWVSAQSSDPIVKAASATSRRRRLP